MCIYHKKNDLKSIIWGYNMRLYRDWLALELASSGHLRNCRFCPFCFPFIFQLLWSVNTTIFKTWPPSSINLNQSEGDYSDFVTNTVTSALHWQSTNETILIGESKQIRVAMVSSNIWCIISPNDCKGWLSNGALTSSSTRSDVLS